MKNLFGTDGMRGEAGQFPLDKKTVTTVGFSLARHLRSQLGRDPVIVVGRDTRESGSWLEQALIHGSIASGARCESAGIITTPGVAYLARTLPADAGIVISASHNPYHDNGIKVFAPSGRKLDDSTERKIEADIFGDLTIPQGHSDATSILNNGESLRNGYLDFLADEIGKSLSLSGLTLVVDCANGAASNLAPQLFGRLGANVVAINNQPNGKNINQNSGSLHLDSLKQKTLSERAELGIAFDGDADRALFVNRDGSVIDGDATLWVLANYFVARGLLHKGIVVATVMSNVGLEIALRSRGITLYRTDVGDKYVLDELLRLNASLGGEQSGHIIIPELSLAGDGMITTLSLLRALQDGGKSLTESLEGFERYPQILINVRVREKRPFSEIETVDRIRRELEEALAGRGRLLLRYSGTEPLARIMIEGQDLAEIEGYGEKLAVAIREVLGSPEPRRQ
jgi:phosphoglucosamine mutase